MEADDIITGPAGLAAVGRRAGTEGSPGGARQRL